MTAPIYRAHPRKTPKARDASQWHLTSTAPKNGTWLHVWGRDFDGESYGHVFWNGSSWDNGEHEVINIGTHWQHLHPPRPPK